VLCGLALGGCSPHVRGPAESDNATGRPAVQAVAPAEIAARPEQPAAQPEQPAARHEQPAGTKEREATMQRSSGSSRDAPESIAWQWSSEPGAPSRDVTLEADGARFVLVRAADGSVAGVKRVDASGHDAWSAAVASPVANTAALLFEGGRLYAAMYSDIATGAEVAALDAASGKIVWRTRLQGLGPLHHSKYHNRVQLRFAGGWLAVFGDESAGKYIEVLDPANGSTVFNRRV
jgi:hypothetical protein